MQDDSLSQLSTSIKENGRYELISGHRRKKAMKLIGLAEAEVIVENLNDDETTIYMVDSNMYRDKISVDID